MSTQRTSEAVDWFMCLTEPDVSERELSRWIQWCADAENLREFERVRATWRGFGELGPAAVALLETSLPSVQESISATLADRPRQHWPPWSAAMAAMLLVAVVIFAWRPHSLGLDDRAQIVARDRIKTTSLPDGSILTLAPKTNVTIDFSGHDRAISFAHGEAHFEVQPDKERPFVVQTAGVNVTAVGTAFDVRSEGEQVTVTVYEGVVEVASAGRSPERVAAGERMLIDASKHIANVKPADVTRGAGWREGRLEYFGAPLSTVVADISRYSNTPVEIGDPQLAQLSYTGSVFTHAIDDWLGALESAFPVRVITTRDDRVVLLSSGEQPHD